MDVSELGETQRSVCEAVGGSREADVYVSDQEDPWLLLQVRYLDIPSTDGCYCVEGCVDIQMLRQIGWTTGSFDETAVGVVTPLSLSLCLLDFCRTAGMTV